MSSLSDSAEHDADTWLLQSSKANVTSQVDSFDSGKSSDQN